MTTQELKVMLSSLRGVFDVARIVDPETQQTWDFDGAGEFRPVSICYQVWKKDKPCENCTTLGTCRDCVTSDKYEVLDKSVFHITSKPVEVDGRRFALEIVTRLDNINDVNRREALLHAQERNMEIIDILASEYSSVYYIDLLTDELDPYTMNEETENEFGHIFRSGIHYSDAFRLYVESLVYEPDRETMLEIGSLTNIAAQLRDRKSFTATYRSDNAGNPHYCEVKFVKVGSPEAEPTAVALGFSDRDGEIRREMQIQRDQEIVRTLSDEYTSVYHVNLDTHEMTISKLREDMLDMLHGDFYQDMDFSDALRLFLGAQVHNSDFDELVRFGDADYIRELLREQKIYTRTYRVGTETDFRYNEMKLVKVNDDEYATSIVLGIAEKDAEVRARLKAEVERQRNTEIIEILASEYTSVYYIDLTTDELTPYTMNEETENQFGVLFKHMKYTEAFRMYVDRLIAPADRQMMLKAGSVGNIMRELRHKKTFITTYRSDLGGEERYCEMKFVKVGTEDGAPRAVALGFADKDDELRKRIEEETIRKRNTEIIEILASEYTSVYYIDLTTDELDPYTMNEETENEFGQVFRSGIKYSDAFRLYVDTMVYAEDKEKMLRAGSLYNILLELHDKKTFITTYRSDTDGTPRYCEMKFVKVGDDDNPQAVALGFSVVDEAYRRQLAEKQREGFISGLADDYEAVFHVELDGGFIESIRITDAYKSYSPSFHGDMGYSDYVRLASERVFPEDRAAFLEALSPANVDATFRRESAFFHNYRILRDGKPFYYQLKLIHTGDWATDHNFLIGVHNMDESMRAQAAQEETLKAARVEAEAANRAKSTFLFNMSHDIRTPMNAIIGFNSMALKHMDDPEKLQDCLEKVNLSSQHLLSIINDVLDMARIESGKVTIEEAPVSITEEAGRLSSIVQQTVKDKQLHFETDFSRVIHDRVYADALRVNRVLMNVANNAVKYTGFGGTVRYSIREVDSELDGWAAFDFIVQDTGIGMSSEYLAHIFEPFTREKSSTNSGVQGTGLGMAITRELVEMMNGGIHIDSAPGMGTTVTVHLEFRITDEATIQQAKQHAELDMSPLKHKRVLLAEDNELNREIAGEILEDFGLTVDMAENGAIAVDKCTRALEAMRRGDHSLCYDFILMDIQMPVMDGYEATRRIRALSADYTRKVPIIAMTANAFSEDKKAALDAGMDAHLSKPINIEELAHALLKQLE